MSVTKNEVNLNISPFRIHKGGYTIVKMGKVNLDALIPREDLEVIEDIQDSNKSDKISLQDLKFKTSHLYPILRKPDFQRETNEWNPNKVMGLIESFVNGDLIPALIMWRTKGSNTFVIDGAHRLSALIAWVNDDYGDGVISRNFFEDISEEQKKIAEKTRKLVNETIKPFAIYMSALDNPKNLDTEIINKARDIISRVIQLQWVSGGVKKAEDSFFKINQEAVKISPTELVLSKVREKPNGLSARAIKNRGGGHKYWNKFDEETRKKIEELSKEIYDLIFIPPLKQPIKSIEFLPIAGKSDSAYALPLVLNFVNITNGLMDKEPKDILDDKDGKVTLEYLQKCKKIALRINTNDTSSLGLHPIRYLYSPEGNYKIVSFYALIALILEFDKNKELQKNFITVRKEFEQILLEYEGGISELVRKYRAGVKGYIHIKDFYINIINKLLQEESRDKLMKELKQKEDKKLRKSKDFSNKTKSAIVIREYLSKALVCSICGGLMDPKSITIDHKQRKRDGGIGTIDNGQPIHPYCNSIIKN